MMYFVSPKLCSPPLWTVSHTGYVTIRNHPHHLEPWKAADLWHLVTWNPSYQIWKMHFWNLRNTDMNNHKKLPQVNCYTRSRQPSVVDIVGNTVDGILGFLVKIVTVLIIESHRGHLETWSSQNYYICQFVKQPFWCWFGWAIYQAKYK